MKSKLSFVACQVTKTKVWNFHFLCKKEASLDYFGRVQIPQGAQIKATTLDRLAHLSALTANQTLSEYKHRARTPNTDRYIKSTHALQTTPLILKDIKQCRNVTIRQRWRYHISREPFGPRRWVIRTCSCRHLVSISSRGRTRKLVSIGYKSDNTLTSSSEAVKLPIRKKKSGVVILFLY